MDVVPVAAVGVVGGVEDAGSACMPIAHHDVVAAAVGHPPPVDDVDVVVEGQPEVVRRTPLRWPVASWIRGFARISRASDADVSSTVIAELRVTPVVNAP